jgi:hypothetical protein
MFWINKTHSFGHIHIPPFLFQIMTFLPIKMIDQKLQDFLKSLLPNSHLLKSLIKQIEGKVNIKLSPQVNLNRIKIESNPKVNLNKEKI